MDTNYVITILKALRHLEKITMQIDELVFDKALCTNIRLADCAYNSAEKQIEKVLQLMQKKNNLINLKLITDEHLSKLNEEYRMILKMRYLEMKKPAAIIETLGISERTYFRYLKNAYKSLAKQFTLGGYDAAWFEENYFDQSWLRSLYKRVTEGGRNED